MKAAKPNPADEMRMSIEEFERIMSQALRVKPERKKARQPPKQKAGAGLKKIAK